MDKGEHSDAVVLSSRNQWSLAGFIGGMTKAEARVDYHGAWPRRADDWNRVAVHLATRDVIAIRG